ncbi:MAG: hypothetical protein AB1670_07770 [Pseudomonadota bacterium]
MNDKLKVAGRIGAELGAAKAEVERLREVLSRIANLPMYHCSTENDYRLSAAKAMAVAALSQQAEPTDTYTAVDMATAAAQGFRDGQAAVEQAAAQDELWAVHAQGPDELYAAFGRDDAEQHAAALNALPMPAGIQVSATVIASPWSAAEHWKYLAEQEREHAAELKARAAQTEQHPMAYAVFAANGNVVCFSTRRDHPSLVALERNGHSVVTLAPIAQTAPQTEQSGLVEALRTEALGLCDVVEKINSLSPVTYALQAGRAINKVRDAAAALSAQWTAEQ